MTAEQSPASAGSMRPAGEGLSDEEAAAEVSAQTSSDLKAEDVFRREAEGADADVPAEEMSADDLSE